MDGKSGLSISFCTAVCAFPIGEIAVAASGWTSTVNSGGRCSSTCQPAFEDLFDKICLDAL